MNVLLLSMPDSFEHMPAGGVRMPNGALASLAANVDAHHRVAVADLILVQRSVDAAIRRLMREHDPEVVGLSVMTFQRETAFSLMALLRTIKPGVQLVVGGYDPSLAREAYLGSEADFIVRGEGEVTFCELLRAVEQDRGFEAIDGLSWRAGNDARDPWRHNRNRGLADPATNQAAEPRRQGAVRLHDQWAAGGCHRDLAGLHVRLQLLLDHRDARTQLQPVLDRAGDRRHRGRARAWRAGDVPSRRQHRARRQALPCAVRGDHRRCSAAGSTIDYTDARR